MFGILVSALMSMLGFLLRSVLVKFVTFFALWFVVTEFVTVLQGASVFPSANSLNGAFIGLSPGIWFFMDLFAFPFGIPLVIAASVSRFIIRRIPLIG
ncbi:DUF2523 family protein [Herbaspirillum sp. NPDC101397]|uniref:DUF2523 family protein n=1 Tax=Herbaspirillum sp. NPDC101397 TaxID=3364006 RepID=UPI00383A1DFF